MDESDARGQHRSRLQSIQLIIPSLFMHAYENLIRIAKIIDGPLVRGWPNPNEDQISRATNVIQLCFFNDEQSYTARKMRMLPRLILQTQTMHVWGRNKRETCLKFGELSSADPRPSQRNAMLSSKTTAFPKDSLFLKSQTFTLLKVILSKLCSSSAHILFPSRLITFNGVRIVFRSIRCPMNISTKKKSLFWFKHDFRYSENSVGSWSAS